MVTKNTTHRLCPGCGQILPVEDFAWRMPAMKYRSWLCRDCAKEYQRAYNLCRRNKTFNGMARDIASATSNQIPKIVNRMLDRFGGLGRFCEAWHDAIAESKKLRPGGRIIFNHLNAICRLVQFVSENQPDPENMSDEDLAEARSGFNQIRGDA